MIRKAAKSDLDAIATINDAVQPSPWTREAISSEISHGDFIGFVYENSPGKLDGYLLSRTHCDGADLMIIGVVSNAQKKGVGRALVEAFFQAVRPLVPGGEIFLEVSHRNQKAISFYQGFGFQTYLIRRAYYRDGSDALCMKLALAKTQ